MTIRIRSTLKKRRLATASLQARLVKLLRAVGLPDGELGVLFIGDCAMRSLNRRYRGKDRTTDVLSFSLREGAFSEIRSALLGDIVISVPAAARQARRSGHSLQRELERLLIHGLLHLAGYDHERNELDAVRMRRRERLLLRALATAVR